MGLVSVITYDFNVLILHWQNDEANAFAFPRKGKVSKSPFNTLNHTANPNKFGK